MESADVDYLAASVCTAVTTDDVRQLGCTAGRAGAARRAIEGPVRGSSLPCLCSWGLALRYSHLVLLFMCSLLCLRYFLRNYRDISSITAFLLDLYILQCVPSWVRDS